MTATFWNPSLKTPKCYSLCQCSVRQCRFPTSLLKSFMTLSCCKTSGTFNLYSTLLFLFRKHRDNIYFRPQVNIGINSLRHSSCACHRTGGVYPNTLAHRALGQNQSSQLVWRVAHAQYCRLRTSLLCNGHLVNNIVR